MNPTAPRAGWEMQETAPPGESREHPRADAARNRSAVITAVAAAAARVAHAIPALAILILSMNAQAMPAKLVIGAHEWIRILPEDLVIQARIDTGAETASLSAIDIEHFKREGENWVRFRVIDEAAGIDQTLERPRLRWARIKNRAVEAHNGKDYDRRPVVALEICLDDRTRTIDVNLTDRRRFEYAMLIGREGILQFDAVVDPALGADIPPNCASGLAPDKKPVPTDP